MIELRAFRLCAWAMRHDLHSAAAFSDGSMLLTSYAVLRGDTITVQDRIASSVASVRDVLGY